MEHTILGGYGARMHSLLVGRVFPSSLILISSLFQPLPGEPLAGNRMCKRVSPGLRLAARAAALRLNSKFLSRPPLAVVSVISDRPGWNRFTLSAAGHEPASRRAGDRAPHPVVISEAYQGPTGSSQVEKSGVQASGGTFQAMYSQSVSMSSNVAEVPSSEGYTARRAVQPSPGSHEMLRRTRMMRKPD